MTSHIPTHVGGPEQAPKADRAQTEQALRMIDKALTEIQSSGSGSIPIGGILLMAKTTTPDTSFALADGTANSSGNGGSGLNLGGRYIKAITSGSPALGSVTGGTDTKLINLTIGDHGKADVAQALADHDLGTATFTVGDPSFSGDLNTTSGPSATVLVDNNNDGTQVAVATDTHTHTVTPTGSNSSGSASSTSMLVHGASGGNDLSHTITETAHFHDITTFELSRVQLLAYERIA